jgi:hypothetical protein
MIVDLNEERRKKQRGDRWDRWFAILEQDALIETKSRAFRALWIEYQDASAGRKREILLSLREQYRALPSIFRRSFGKNCIDGSMISKKKKFDVARGPKATGVMFGRFMFVRGGHDAA